MLLSICSMLFLLFLYHITDSDIMILPHSGGQNDEILRRLHFAPAGAASLSESRPQPSAVNLGLPAIDGAHNHHWQNESGFQNRKCPFSHVLSGAPRVLATTVLPLVVSFEFKIFFSAFPLRV